jgi:hypothetical protein
MAKFKPKRSKEENEQARQTALEQLRTLLPPGSTVTTVTRQIRRDGTGLVAVLAYDPAEKKIGEISGPVSNVTGADWDDIGGVWTYSPFDLVHRLSAALHGPSRGTGSQAEQNGTPLHNPDPDNYKEGYSLHHQPL